MFSPKKDDNFKHFREENASFSSKNDKKSNLNCTKASENRGKRAAFAASNVDVPAKNNGFSEKSHKNKSFSASTNAAGLYRGDIKTDPDGSYTGRPSELSEVPVQDADDL